MPQGVPAGEHGVKLALLTTTTTTTTTQGPRPNPRADTASYNKRSKYPNKFKSHHMHGGAKGNPPFLHSSWPAAQCRPCVWYRVHPSPIAHSCMKGMAGRTA